MTTSSPASSTTTMSKGNRCRSKCLAPSLPASRGIAARGAGSCRKSSSAFENAARSREPVPGACFIPLGRFVQLARRGIVDANSRHQARFRRFRIRESTSSGSRSVASPARSLLILRQISLSHSAFESASDGPSKLAMRSRASSALSPRGRDNAYCRTLSSSFVLTASAPREDPLNDRASALGTSQPQRADAAGVRGASRKCLLARRSGGALGFGKASTDNGLRVGPCQGRVACAEAWSQLLC